MLMDTVSQLEILIEHGPQRQRHRLSISSVSCLSRLGRILTLSIIYDVGGVSFGS